jgi:hypothetical protein
MPANAFTPLEFLYSIQSRLLGLDVNSDLLAAPLRPYEIVSTVTQGASTGIVLVTMQVCDRYGVAVSGLFSFDWHLSDDTVAGSGLTATTASGAVGASGLSGNGVDLSVYVAKKATRSMTNAAGLYQLSITDSAKTAFNVVTDFEMGFKYPARIQASLVAGDYHT